MLTTWRGSPPRWRRHHGSMHTAVTGASGPTGRTRPPVLTPLCQPEDRPVMKQSRERSPRSLRTTAKLFQASTALAIPLLRALAKPPMNDRIGAPQVCADTESTPALTIQQLIRREMSQRPSPYSTIRRSSTYPHSCMNGSMAPCPESHSLSPPAHRTRPHPLFERSSTSSATATGTRPYGQPTTARTASTHWCPVRATTPYSPRSEQPNPARSCTEI